MNRLIRTVACMLALYAVHALDSVSIVSSAPLISEGGSAATLTLTRSTGEGTLTVRLMQAGSASAGSDIPVLPQSITFAPGQTAFSVTLTATDDQDVESLPECAAVAIATDTAYAVGSPNACVVGVIDNDGRQQRVMAWGHGVIDFSQSRVPSDLSDPLAIAAGSTFSAVLQADTVVRVMGGWAGSGSTAPATLTRTCAIATGSGHTLALTTLGSVAAWGTNELGQATIPAGLAGVCAISASSAHSVALRTDGTVIAWGDNRYGQSSVPAGLDRVCAIAAGGSFTLAQKFDGTVVGWGDNSSGQLNIPADLGSVLTLAAGSSHVLAITSDGSVRAWGSNTAGQASVPAGLGAVMAIAAGTLHSVAVRVDGTVAAWGSSSSGQLAIPSGLHGVRSVAAGPDHTMVLGDLPAQGTLAFSTANFVQSVTGGPTTATIIVNRVGGSFGAIGANVSTSNGTAQAFNDYTKTTTYLSWANGDVSSKSISIPIAASAAGKTVLLTLSNGPTSGPNPALLSITSQAVVSITASAPILAEGGSGATVAIRRSPAAGSLTVGLQTAGAAGSGSDYAPLPSSLTFADGQAVATLPLNIINDATIERDETVVVSLVPGPGSILGAQSMCLVSIHDDDGGAPPLRSWGVDSWLESAPDGLDNIGAVSAGGGHSLALRMDGTLAAWGRDDVTQTTLPSNIGPVAAIAAGPDHSAALRFDGTVLTWGGNPQLISTSALLTGVCAISAGQSRTVALRSDGTVVEWGKLRNSTSDVLMPAGLDRVVAVAAGSWHVLALRLDGTVTAWGNTDDQKLDVPAGLGQVVAIAAGEAHSVALRSDGTVVSWGMQYHDPVLGRQVYTPPGLHDVVAIDAGGYRTMALHADGTVTAWTGAVLDPSTTGLSSVTAISTGGSTSAILGHAAQGSLEFASTTFAQAAGTSTVNATVTVNRIGGFHGAMTVDYATSDGSALAGIDYTARSGTLAWGNGETSSKTFTVPIAAGAYGADRTIRLDLGNVTGGQIGQADSAILTITKVHETTVSLSSLSSARVNGPFDIRAGFLVPVSGFIQSDITVTGGTISMFSGSGSSYSWRITPNAANVSVSVAAGRCVAIIDGRPNQASNLLTRIYDVAKPTVVLSAPAQVRGPFTATATFNEPVNGLALSNIKVTNGLASSLIALSNTTYSWTVTPTASGALTIALPASVTTDLAGNLNNAATTLNRTADLVPPTVTLSSTAPALVAKAFTVSIAFSESVTGFTVDDLVVTGATRGTLSTVTAGKAYSCILTPLPSTQGPITVVVPSATALDGQGNPNSGPVRLDRLADTILPQLTLSSTSPPTVGGSFPLAISASEDVTGLLATDLVVTNGTVTSFSGSGAVYSCIVRPSGLGTVSVKTAAGAAADAAGNTTPAATVLSRTMAVSNNACASALPLAGWNGAVAAANFGATAESGEPAHAGIAAAASVWWTWTAPGSGTLTVDTVGSLIDTQLAVYTGTLVNALVVVGGNANISTSVLQSRVTTSVTKGATYRIAVDGKGGAKGLISMNWSLVADNNAFLGAHVIGGASGSDDSATWAAGREPGEVLGSGAGAGQSLWWTYTSTSSGTLHLSTAGSAIATVLCVAEGSSVAALTAVAQDVSDASGTAELDMIVTAGATYRIMIDAAASAALRNGDVVLTWTMTPSSSG